MPTGSSRIRALPSVPHVLSATVIGNTLTASLDGIQMISVPNQAAATVADGKYSGFTINPPTAGEYGLRAWGNALATIQQTAVTPLP